MFEFKNWCKGIHSFSFLYVLYIMICVCMCLQSRRSTAQSTVQATCAAGLPVSWEQRGRARRTSRIAPTSAAWWRWDASTLTRLPSLMEKSRLNPQSSSRAMPWMANSPLLIKGRIEFQQQCGRGLYLLFITKHTNMIHLCSLCHLTFFLFLLQSYNHSWLSSSRVAWDVVL